MQSGDYDGGSFSGNATARLMARRHRGAGQHGAHPELRQHLRGAQEASPTTRWTACPTACRTAAARTCSCTTPKRSRRPRPRWDRIWNGENGDKVSVYDSADFIADAALHLMTTQPDLGITNPYQLNDAQFAAAIALLEKQRDAGAQYWSVLHATRWRRTPPAT